MSAQGRNQPIDELRKCLVSTEELEQITDGSDPRVPLSQVSASFAKVSDRMARDETEWESGARLFLGKQGIKVENDRDLLNRGKKIVSERSRTESTTVESRPVMSALKRMEKKKTDVEKLCSTVLGRGACRRLTQIFPRDERCVNEVVSMFEKIDIAESGEVRSVTKLDLGDGWVEAIWRFVVAFSHRMKQERTVTPRGHQLSAVVGIQACFRDRLKRAMTKNWKEEGRLLADEMENAIARQGNPEGDKLVVNVLKTFQYLKAKNDCFEPYEDGVKRDDKEDWMLVWLLMRAGFEWKSVFVKGGPFLLRFDDSSDDMFIPEIPNGDVYYQQAYCVMRGLKDDQGMIVDLDEDYQDVEFAEEWEEVNNEYENVIFITVATRPLSELREDPQLESAMRDMDNYATMTEFHRVYLHLICYRHHELERALLRSKEPNVKFIVIGVHALILLNVHGVYYTYELDDNNSIGSKDLVTSLVSEMGDLLPTDDRNMHNRVLLYLRLSVHDKAECSKVIDAFAAYIMKLSPQGKPYLSLKDDKEYTDLLEASGKRHGVMGRLRMMLLCVAEPSKKDEMNKYFHEICGKCVLLRANEVLDIVSFISAFLKQYPHNEPINEDIEKLSEEFMVVIMRALSVCDQFSRTAIMDVLDLITYMREGITSVNDSVLKLWYDVVQELKPWEDVANVMIKFESMSHSNALELWRQNVLVGVKDARYSESVKACVDRLKGRHPDIFRASTVIHDIAWRCISALTESRDVPDMSEDEQQMMIVALNELCTMHLTSTTK